jgi:hypothetical protein
MLHGRCKVMAAILTVLVCGAIGLAGADFVHQHAFKNNVKTAGVDVRIDQYHKTERGIEPIETYERVSPGEVSSYIPRVTNLREEGFVRVRMEISMDNAECKPVTVDDVTDIGADWVKKGEYFYCMKVLDENERSDVFKGIRIPLEWTNETASGFSVVITADVVQSRNFEPDFNSISPWGSLEIEKRADSGKMRMSDEPVSYRSAKAIDRPDFTITESKSFECTTTDLFSGFATMVPGDVCSEEMPIKNRTKNDLKVYFRTENISSDLLSKMGLRIRCGERTVYEGDLVSDKLGTFMELTEIRPGEQDLLQFEIELGRDAKNRYQDLRDDVIWIFAIEEMKDGGTVGTGDEKGRFLWMLTAICTATLIIVLSVLLYGKRRRQK